METNKYEILFKVLWIVLVLTTFCVLGWMTFGYLTIGNIFSKKFTTFNFLIPNILTIILLIIYTEELLIGYRPQSKNRNLISLLFFFILIITLIFFQVSQFDLILDELIWESWFIILPLTIVSTSYLGILLNRILEIKSFSRKKTTVNQKTE